MELIIWNESLSTDIPLIDEQHKKLIDKINKFYECVHETHSNCNLELLLDSLIDYAYYHFDTEERFFDKYTYPDKDLHKSEHKDFKNKINEYFDRLIDSKECLAMEILTYLNNWLIRHIMNVDKNYTDFLKEKINSSD